MRRLRFVAAVNGAGLGYDMAVITAGQFSGLNRSLTDGQVTPEAAGCGPLALVRDGDPITIDLLAHRLSIDLADEILTARHDALPAFVSLEKAGWLTLYQSLVQPLSEGAAMKPPGVRYRHEDA
nr:dihydroxy-acid dehydratase [Pseudazoarcus pumilus]